MSIAYVCAVALALFAGGLPLGVFSVIWDALSENLTVGIPYVSILRLLFALGAIFAVILAQRLRRLPVVMDLVIAAVALEAVCLFGFSLSRVFWHLALWTLVLGFGAGMALGLFGLRARGNEGCKVTLLLASGAAGTLVGTTLLAGVLKMGRSWHTACQVLAIVQILVCLGLFLLRRLTLRAMEQTVRERDLKNSRVREQKGKSLGDARAPEQVRRSFLIRLCCAYAGAALSGLLILSACLWPSGVEAQATGENVAAYGICLVCAGLTAGGLLAGLLRWKKKTAWAAGSLLCLGAVCVAAICLGRGSVSVPFLRGVAFVCGLGESTVLAHLILTDDARLDADAVSSLAELIPAFFFGSWAVITPLTQMLFGLGGGRRFALWMLLFAILQTILLAGAAGREGA